MCRGNATRRASIQLHSDRYQPFKRMSRNSATIRHPPTSSHTFPHRVPTAHLPSASDLVESNLEPHLRAQTQVLDRLRKDPTAQNISPGSGASHKPSATSCFVRGLSHANTQRQTEIKSTPPTPFSIATTQRYLPSAGGSAVCAGGVHAAPQETAQRASAESRGIRRNQASHAFSKPDFTWAGCF